MSRNLLHDATSPYLLQHKDNPVHWMPWGEAAFERARAEDKPILLSIGYAACHWCHVMAHESFENERIAELMNHWFVCVKVDREERPDVDRYYMKALHLMGQQGGWPLTMFASPDGRPLWGGTYFPPEPRYGRPSFPQVLEEVARLWREDRDKLLNNARVLSDALAEKAVTSTTELPPDFPARAAYALADMFDPQHGGLRGAPKFPQCPLLELMLAAGRAHERELVITTLTHICQGGIYDHLGGGFARYSTDERWLVPHFEKMLYDNAQLISMLARAHAQTGEPLFRQRIEETIAFLKRDMLIDDAGFASSFDADSEGEEGRFYVWSYQELSELLDDEEHQLFFPIYDVTPSGNWEGKIILNRLRHLSLEDDESEKRLRAIRQKLFKARQRRTPPARDDKVLAAWNGLTIAALAEAGMLLGETAWIDLAAQAFAMVVERLSRDGHLAQSFNRVASPFPATADGMAAMIRAALYLNGATGDDAYRRRALDWLNDLDTHYAAGADAYYMSRDDADRHLRRQVFAEDEATPNAHALMVENLAMLAHITSDEEYRRRAERILHHFAAGMSENPLAHAGLLAAMHFLHHGPALTLMSAADDSRETFVNHEARRLLSAAMRHAGHMLPVVHQQDATTGDAPAVLICRGSQCSIPITDPGQVADAMAILGVEPTA